MIGAGLISVVLGTKLLGVGSIYLGQELKFKAPVFIGDVVTAFAEIVGLDEEKKRAKLVTWCETQDGKKIVDGYTSILFNQ
jgi:3-hydroxybutyryl-CoA dehydratase